MTADGRIEGNQQLGAGGVAPRIYLPGSGLQGYVTFFYFVEVAAPLTDFLYPEWGNVRLSMAGTWMVRMPGFVNEAPQTAVLFGPTDRHGAVETSGGKTVGFGLTPLGWERLIASDASALANRVVPLGSRFGADEQAITAAIAGRDDRFVVDYLESLLRATLADRPPVSEVVLAVDRALRTRPSSLDAFAAAAGVSARTPHRVCRETFGFAPKRLMRLQRFLDTLGYFRAAIGKPLKSALDPDYVDQSHFYRDFRDFMAMTPRQYFGAPRRLMAAAAEAQAMAGVPLSFRLPEPPSDVAVAQKRKKRSPKCAKTGLTA